MEHARQLAHSENVVKFGWRRQQRSPNDPRLEAEMNATDGQWTGEDFDPREWFGDEPDMHHGGRHHRMMHRVHIVLTHLLTFFLGVAFMLLRSRFCPSCGRCCCCKKKPTRVADVVPATVVVVSSAPASDKKPDPEVPSPRA